MQRILLLEPYYGGSHKLFLTGLQQTVKADYLLLSLPARKWKMRMQLSAYWFVQQIKNIPLEKRFFNIVLCSTFVDVAVLRSLLVSIKGWNPETRVVTYFHENQFAYPRQQKDPTMRQFTAINFSTAMASDFCAFNSSYNFDSFVRGASYLLKKTSDMDLQFCIDTIRKKSTILYPGMDYSFIDQEVCKCLSAITNLRQPIIVWNHRWEHDKGPELFFDALYSIKKKGFKFRLIVMGESFANKPDCFQEALGRLKNEIIHFGYASSREEYVTLLCKGDVIVSTARHEYFGISVLEGIRAGCYPLLPADLSYPELYPKRYQYNPGKLRDKLIEYINNPVTLERNDIYDLTEKFSWIASRDQYESVLFEKHLET